MNQRAAICCVLSLGLVLSAPLLGRETDPRLRLALGDPRFKGQTIDVASGQIISMESGRPIPFDSLIREMGPVPFVLVGEAHDSRPMHKLQARIIRALFEQNPGLAIGLEMVPATRQEILTQWSRGLLTDEEFLRKDNWYSAWGFNFAYYQPIFAFAKDNQILLRALDSPQEVVAQFRVRDGEVVREEAKPVVPKSDPAEEGDRIFLRKSLESSDMSAAIKGAVLETMFEDLFRAQAARDA
ncbi:MAG: ChaN family lipoprotein, partial [Candidatus Aminicenantales bacterium]